MNTGVVKFFDTQKGFGFITPNDGGKDVFVHISALSLKGIRSLNDGQKVSYDLQEERVKTSATNINRRLIHVLRAIRLTHGAF